MNGKAGEGSSHTGRLSRDGARVWPKGSDCKSEIVAGSNPAHHSDNSSMSKILNVPTSLTPLGELILLEGREPTKGEWKTWVLESPAVWSDAARYVRVPEGFMTDFASIPFMFRWWQTGAVGPQRVAAYFHDWLYSEQSAIGRRKADQIFRDVMGDAGAGAFRRWAMYLGLRVGGWLAWRSNQKKLAKLGAGWRMLSN